MSGLLRHKAWIAGFLAGLLLLVAWLARDREQAGSVSSRAGTRGGAATSREWMPWFFGGPDGSGPRPYRGPRVEVTVKVVDLTGAPVSGVDVAAMADREEYETAGMTDEEYEAWLDEQEWDDPEDEGEGEGEGEGEDGRDEVEDDWTSVPWETVETGRTDRDGVWLAKLKPDVAVVFHATDGRGREGISPTLELYDEDESDGAALTVTIEIAEIGILTGQVVDPRGTAIEGADISLLSWSSEDLDTKDLLAKNDGARIRTDAGGRFRVELRSSGAFDVEVHAKKFQPAVEQAVQVLPGRETAVSITLMPSAEIAGIVLDPAGQPVPDARVVVQGQPQPGSFISFETDTDEEGRFVAEELAPGDYIVAASAEGFRPAEAWNVASGGREEVVLRLTRGGAIEGTVIADGTLLEQLRSVTLPSDGVMRAQHDDDDDEDGRTGIVYFGDVYIAHAGPETELLPIATGVPRERAGESPSGVIDARGRYFAQVRLDDKGRGGFEVRGLPAGTYAGTVMVGTAYASLGSVRVTEAGVTQVTITLPDRAGGTIAGTVRSEDGREIREGTVFLYGGSLPSGMSAVLRGDSRFEFASVPAGEYMIHAIATVRGASDDGSEDAGVFAPARPLTVPGATRTNVELVLGREEEVQLLLDQVDVEASFFEPPEDWGPIGVSEPGVEDDVPPDDLWSPDVWVEDVDGALVVTWAAAAPDGKRLFGGDRVVSIDGTIVASMETWDALDLLYGPQGSICTIVADRPATRESITVSLPRTRSDDDG